MLSRLSIRNIVLIEALDLSFAPGFTVLTGETGAGKSILLDALSLALGAKAEGGLVRRGEDKGAVSATFLVTPLHPAVALLAEMDIEVEDDAIILRRTLTADGKARGFVNDQPASATLMKSLGTMLVEVHGQHADRGLIQPAAHRRLVDAYGTLGAECEHLGTLWRGLKDAEEALAAHEAKLAAARDEVDYLRASVDELTRLDPEPGEEERLSVDRSAMAAAEKVAGDLAEAASSLEGPKSPIPSLAGVLRKLERKMSGAEDKLTPVMDALAAALDVLEEARTTIADAQRSLDYNPGAMEGLEERLFALRAAARKFKVPVDDLAALAAKMADDLGDIDAGEERLAGLASAVTAAEQAYRDAAATLSDRRLAAASALEADIARELAPLKLDKARFTVRHSEAEPAAEGIDRMEFYVQTNPGSPPGPILKVASGGEFSRFLLALKVSLADRGSASTMIFDEIDTGVGGAVSDAIGARMARLSEAVQVIAVTHAPQVAARADNHLLIAKSHTGSATTQTAVEQIEGEARKEEIARMLAGAVITDEARAAAVRLIEA
ncbi:DNA repair protein RecN [Acuticoccus sp. MNP-M23]|uniref:DNA repair protein RecN n=1 Tax=Acuticoccus sp. MNP-M23 TaxID=3072793 RepID=UPI0028151BFD|nr:DNA repair protein RecN [Acuticoccus sp. MNP-M23]WMS40860.1 DNA repair protein RecN [Acuticoccus sp. MNP-M23]